MHTHLEHTTRETGHRHLSPRAEVAAEVIEYLRPLLRQALDCGNPVALPASWWLAAREEQDGQRVNLWLWYGSEPGHRPAEVCGCVWRHGHDRPPRCEWSVIGLTPHPQALATAGDLERCLAWTWLETEESHTTT